jgi:hypothetical protein
VELAACKFIDTRTASQDWVYVKCEILVAVTNDGIQEWRYWHGYDTLPNLDNMHAMLRSLGEAMIEYHWEAEVIYPASLKPVVLLN